MESFSPACKDNVWTFLRSVANRKRTFSDPFYAEGNAVCKMQLKSVVVDEDEEELLHECEPVLFRCEVAGCGRWLGSVFEQEAHYSTCHRHGCGVCRAQLPSYHALELHLEEAHDSVFQLRSRQQAMYRCFVESCGHLSADADARRRHCVDQHCFPADFCYWAPPPASPASLLAGPPPAGRAASVASSSGVMDAPSPDVQFSDDVVDIRASDGATEMRSSDDVGDVRTSRDVAGVRLPGDVGDVRTSGGVADVRPSDDVSVMRASDDVTGAPSAAGDAHGGRRLRFSYRVPESAVSFGAAAVPSFRRRPTDSGEIDMAALVAALEEEAL